MKGDCHNKGIYHCAARYAVAILKCVCKHCGQGQVDGDDSCHSG